MKVGDFVVFSDGEVRRIHYVDKDLVVVKGDPIPMSDLTLTDHINIYRCSHERDYYVI